MIDSSLLQTTYQCGKVSGFQKKYHRVVGMFSNSPNVLNSWVPQVLRVSGRLEHSDRVSELEIEIFHFFVTPPPHFELIWESLILPTFRSWVTKMRCRAPQTTRKPWGTQLELLRVKIWAPRDHAEPFSESHFRLRFQQVLLHSGTHLSELDHMQ